jgi:uncharacterized protein with von Willebrand factor type A (vWA) domain
MFIKFFYIMRERGLKPSFNRWMTLMEALEKNLADSSLTGFYNLCRCTLLKSEADFDLFDEVFAEFFKDAGSHAKAENNIPDDLLNWIIPDLNAADHDIFFSPEHMEILRKLEEAINRLLKKMDELAVEGRFPGGCAVCTGCGLCMGKKSGSARADEEISLPPETEDASKQRWKNALELAAERNYRDFREDTILEVRQFQLAFRKLRQYSAGIDVPPTEFDIEKTIAKTADRAGMLNVVYGRPRKNTVKLLVLFDSDGSMWQHAEVSNRLFQAANKTNHFHDLQFYYFHNCIYDHLYTTPMCVNGEWAETEHIMKNLDSNYRVIYIGDASMADSELFSVGGNVMLERSNRAPGILWLKRLKKHYPRSVWLNPLRKTEWNRLYGGRTIQEVGRIFSMYELTVSGLERAVKALLTAR